MNKKKQTILLFFLFSFSAYCALIIGKSWDEGTDLLHGKSTLNYLFSLGKFDDYFVGREYYSAIYWSLQYLLTTIFPSKYQIEISHLVNLIFSLAAIIGISQLGKELFNKKVGKIVFLILFFYPVFFGHMSINSKDTIIALSHVWIVYLILRYLKKQDIKKKANKYIIYLGFLAALATGIQLVFLGSLIPIIFFVIVEIFFLKKIISKKFSKKIFLYDLTKCFFIFYFLLLLFWKDAHQNIITYPFYIIQKWLYSDIVTGWPYILLNGDYFFSYKGVPSLYFLINFFYKSPEYILLSYLIFLILIIKSSDFFKLKFNFFFYKLSFVVFMLIFPNLIMFFIPFPVYDGMRLFLWVLPYYCIIPGLTIYYLVENFNFKAQKIYLSILSVLFIFYLANFFLMTPYHYTYLNFLSGKTENRYKKFENDYWATSIGELLKNANFKNNKVIKLTTCGLGSAIPKEHLKKRPSIKYRFVPYDEAEYIIMTNRVSRFHGMKNCFDIFEGNNIAVVKRNGMTLSIIRQIKI